MMKPRFSYNPKDGGTLMALNDPAIDLLTKWVNERNEKRKLLNKCRLRYEPKRKI